MSRDWYQDFFHGLPVELWTRVVSPDQTVREADFLEDKLRLADGSRVLDVPCGNGRHAIALAARGHDVVGVDISEDFLARAQAAGGEVQRQPAWHRADMKALPDLGQFDGAYSFGNCLGYLNYDDTLHFFRRLAGSLQAGGRFALETGMLAESILPNLDCQMYYEFGDISMSISHQYQAFESRLDTEYTFQRGTQTETRNQWNWVFSAGEVGRMLAASGLDLIEIRASLDGSAYTLGERLAILVAERT